MIWYDIIANMLLTVNESIQLINWVLTLLFVRMYRFYAWSLMFV